MADWRDTPKQQIMQLLRPSIRSRHIADNILDIVTAALEGKEVKDGNAWPVPDGDHPRIIDVMSLFLQKAGEKDMCVQSTRQPGQFYGLFREFVSRGDCILVLELDDLSEIAVSSESAGWMVATHRVGNPAVLKQIREALSAQGGSIKP